MGKSSGHNVRISPPQTVVMDSNLSFQRLEYIKSASTDCELPASSAPPFYFQLSAKRRCRGLFLFFFICVSASVIGPNFLLQFSSPSAQLPALACCSLVKQTRLKSSSWMAAGGSAPAWVMNYSFTFMLGAHRVDTSLHCAPSYGSELKKFHSLPNKMCVVLSG